MKAFLVVSAFIISAAILVAYGAACYGMGLQRAYLDCAAIITQKPILSGAK